MQNLMGSSKEQEQPRKQKNMALEAIKDVEHTTKALDTSSKKYGRTGVILLQPGAEKKKLGPHDDDSGTGLKNPLTRLFREFMLGRLGDSSLSFPIIISAFRRKRLTRACCGDYSGDMAKHVEEGIANRQVDRYAEGRFVIPEGITVGLAAAKNNLIKYSRQFKQGHPFQQEK
jgi:hypothetical protein